MSERLGEPQSLSGAVHEQEKIMNSGSSKPTTPERASSSPTVGSGGLSDCDTLKLAGFSPFKAAQIALDAKRNDSYAIGWVRYCRAAISRAEGR